MQYNTWAPNTAYTQGTYILPPVSNGYYYVCVSPGTSGGSQPAWSTIPGSTFIDNVNPQVGVVAPTWQCAGIYSTALPPVQFSSITMDFDDLVTQMQNALATKESWRAIIASEAGSTLIEYIAALGVFLKTGVRDSYLENWIDTAQADSSLKAIARTLGVRLRRNSPATVIVNLTVSNGNFSYPYTIPPYSQFSAPNTVLFNREAITFTANNTTQVATLYEGQVNTAYYDGTGADFQNIIVPVSGFQISDVDVVVTVGTTSVTTITDGIWHYQNLGTTSSYVVQDFTLPTGELNLTFGNSLFGYVPPSGTNNIKIIYVVTKGAEGNDATFNQKTVTYTLDSSISGNSLTTTQPALVNGEDPPSSSVYRISPLLFASYNRAVTMADHSALAVTYPNISDALFLGQSSIAPSTASYANVVYAYILTSDGTTWTSTSSDWQNFLQYLQSKAPPFNYLLQQITGIPVSVSTTIYCNTNADLSKVKQDVTTALNNLFAPRYGYIGRTIAINDIYNTITTANANIDYAIVTSPTSDTYTTFNPPSGVLAAPTTGGSLTQTTYYYVVTSLTSAGETFYSAVSTVTLLAGQNAATITWDSVPGVTGYRVYGRVNNSFVRINTTDLSSSTLTWTDAGSDFTAPTWVASTIYAADWKSGYPFSTGTVTSVAVTNAGSGYTTAPTVTIDAPTHGAGVQATATANISSGVTGTTVTAGGTGYTSAPTVSFTGGGGTGATAIATITGVVESVTVNNGGTGYTTATVSFTGGGGTGAAATATIVGGIITGITVTTAGTGYTSAPTVAITGDGSGAVATSVITNIVESLTITNAGTGYTSAPTVSFSGGSGSGAAATAAISGTVVSITITNAGTGYTVTPNVAFSGGGGSGAAATATITGTAFAQPTTPNGHVYKCTTSGISGTTEPTWPTGAGATVTDGTITWTEAGASFVGKYVQPTVSNGYYYKTSTGGVSGATQPTWPVTINTGLIDNTVSWVTSGAFAAPVITTAGVFCATVNGYPLNTSTLPFSVSDNNIVVTYTTRRN